MSGLAPDVLKGLYHLPKDRDLLPSESEDSFLQPLGYTIYRTCYLAESDEPWEVLQRELSQTFHNAICKADDSPEVVSKLLSLVKLDFRSDPNLLNDLDIDQVREIYTSGNDDSPPPLNKDKAWRRVFLLADEEVLLGEHDQLIKYDAHIKCVQADYEAPDPTVKRREPIRYFGWMKMRTGSLWELCEELTMRDLSEIAPGTIGGAHLVICKFVTRGSGCCADGRVIGEGQ